MNAVDLALAACGGFFLTGMLTGVWKYRCIMRSPEAQAPVYVDICHRTSLMYAFSALILAEFAGRSAWPAWVNLLGVAVPVLFFASAIAGYALHGWLRDTDNQLRRPHVLGRSQVPGVAVRLYMALLIAGEVGGFLLLFSGWLRA